MAYLLFILFVILYSKHVSFFKVKKWNAIKYLPVYIFFIFIFGLQFKVGTDYNSYLELASTKGDIGWIENKSEFSFVYINKLVIALGWPQLIFFLAALIQIIFLSRTINDLELIYELKIEWFFFFFFTLSLIFFNSFNGIRQYIAIYISFYSLIKLIQGKSFFFILGILFASSFHSSALFLLIFYLIRPLLFVKFNFYFILFIILCSGYFGLFYLQNFISEYIGLTQYGEYLKSDYFYLEIDLINILTKLPKVLVVLSCAFFLEVKYDDLSVKYKPLLNLSYLSLIFLMLSMFSPMLWRFYQYFDIFLIFPPLILFSYNRQKDFSYIIIALLFLILLLKILIFDDYEYSYNSILFNN